ncbi:MAG: hypothetical protein [Microviridae sp.]|nr:MAG: hypothetical protein [Microviridae sp.]
MARKTRRRRTSRQSHETQRQYRRNAAYQTYPTLRRKQTRSRKSLTQNRSNIIRSRLYHNRGAQQTSALAKHSRVGVLRSPTRSIHEITLQAQPSLQARKEHKCIKKPNSKTAGSGSGKYKGQWKPWCI